MTIQELAIEAWNIYDQFEKSDRILKPSIPILYFGDYHKYCNSPIKIVSVGLNPSSREFPPEDPFIRFRGGGELSRLSNDYLDNYLSVLNSYFYSPKAYLRWFGSIEKILTGFHSSYLGSSMNTALHTDLLSPLATDPTWDKLVNDYPVVASELSIRGINLWHRLIAHLKPDVVLISMRKSYLEQVKFSQVPSWKILISLPHKKQSNVLVSKAWIQGTNPLIVRGRAANTPFGTLNYEEKKLIGPKALELLK